MSIKIANIIFHPDIKFDHSSKYKDYFENKNVGGYFILKNQENAPFLIKIIPTNIKFIAHVRINTSNLKNH